MIITINCLYISYSSHLGSAKYLCKYYPYIIWPICILFVFNIIFISSRQILYSFIVHTDNNTERYTIFQMHFSFTTNNNYYCCYSNCTCVLHNIIMICACFIINYFKHLLYRNGSRRVFCNTLKIITRPLLTTCKHIRENNITV